MMSSFQKLHNCEYYLTHDNFNRPFCVYVDKIQNKVHVYKKKNDNYTKLIRTFAPLQIFIGESHVNEMTSFSGGHGPNFDGNSILLKIDDFEYVFIGEKIYSFKTKHEIVMFASPVGNNDVPYPYAMDDKENYYFLLDEDTGILRIDDVTKRDDPYRYFYFIQSNIQEIENINYMYMGNEAYTMRTSSNPERDYDSLIERLGYEGPMYIEFKGEDKKRISRDEYIRLLENYNKNVGLLPLEDVKIIEKRHW
jgi:hypothetical protein